MPTGSPPRVTTPLECLLDSAAWPAGSAGQEDDRGRLGRLAHALESDVIPRLLRSHGADPALQPRPDVEEVASFAQALLDADEAEIAAALVPPRRRGHDMASVCLDLLAPAARLLGQWWSEDRCDFASVTVALGRLQRLLHELSPAFGREVKVPVGGRRILLSQHPDEQHSFGLVMVAEFFRRHGWDVLGGVGTAVREPARLAATEWFDAVGFSLGSEQRAEWARERIAEVRRDARNRRVVVLVGGPLIVGDPSWADRVGADVAGVDAMRALRLLEPLISRPGGS